MDGKITDAKNLAFLLSIIFIALFVGISFVNAFVGGILLAVSVLFIVFGIVVYGLDEDDN